jgi:hypothetical protein
MTSAQKLGSARRLIDAVRAASTFDEASELIARASSDLRSVSEKLLAEAVQMHTGKRNAQALKRKAREWRDAKIAYYQSDELMKWIFDLRHNDQHGTEHAPAISLEGHASTGELFYESIGPGQSVGVGVDGVHLIENEGTPEETKRLDRDHGPWTANWRAVATNPPAAHDGVNIAVRDPVTLLDLGYRQLRKDWGEVHGSTRQ